MKNASFVAESLWKSIDIPTIFSQKNEKENPERITFRVSVKGHRN
jgi:hypothetical protein